MKKIGIFLFVLHLIISPVLCSVDFDQLKIGAFNIQTFGKAKYGNETIRGYLIDIVVRYDVLLIQEIRDVSETMIFDFLVDCQRVDPLVDMVVSPRLGRTRYKEQYAVFYKTDKAEVKKHTVYSNPRDLFNRPPMIVHFSTLTEVPRDFTLYGVHVDPDDVVQELDDFPAAYDYALSQSYPTFGLLVGDLNADCSYLSNSKYTQLALSSDDRFIWLMDKSHDTTTSLTTDCSYDRIVQCGPLPPATSLSLPQIDYFDTSITNELSRKISDHYPVYITWNLGPGTQDDTSSAGTQWGVITWPWHKNSGVTMTDLISDMRDGFRGLLCAWFPEMEQYKDKDWFGASVLFLTFVVLYLVRSIVCYFNL